MTAPALAIPGPGEHSRQPKYWASVHRWVTNFTPFALEAGPIVGLSPDADGGLWFAIGKTVEHIERSGRMTSYAVTENSGQWLWQVWDIARDANGRRWFSIGQSGRIGTFDKAGHLRTSVVVARKYYSDIRTLRFARDGTLWFVDAGRRSIGHRAKNGTVTEVPMPDGAMPVGLSMCRGSVFVAAQDATYDAGRLAEAMYIATSPALALKLVHAWPLSDMSSRRGMLSVACDRRRNLWFAHVGTRVRATDGYFDTTGRLHEQRSLLTDEHVFELPDGGVLFAGGRSAGRPRTNADRVAIVTKASIKSTDLTLPMAAEWFDGEAAGGADGTVWLVSYPYPLSRLSLQP